MILRWATTECQTGGSLLSSASRNKGAVAILAHCLLLAAHVCSSAQASNLLAAGVSVGETIKTIAELSTTTTTTTLRPVSRQDYYENELAHDQLPSPARSLAQGEIEKRAFVAQLLEELHGQYGATTTTTADEQQMQSRQGLLGLAAGPEVMHSLLSALGADGDVRRLIEWVRNRFNVASVPDVSTQYVVSKLGSVNCPALLRPDKEESLVPRFLLFNEHFPDVPYELSISPDRDECLANAKFDPRRKTILLVHGYLTGYTLVDGVTNIKNRLLDLNRQVSERATLEFSRAAAAESNFAAAAAENNSSRSSHVHADGDLGAKILRSQLYNVILIDWFNGANPTPRSNYIKAAVNAQVVGKLIARFLSALVERCGTPAANLQILAHSLGCHVSGFTGKAMNAAGHRLGKITHLDPVGLCFGRLFSQPRFRLSPSDALETQAVHVSLNIFDNPLDGAQSNFLVNGGRDQLGCGGQSEVKNSTASSVSLLFDPAARFGPCSHMRALSLFEDDHSSQAGQCQLVGYRCASYDKFLAGKCGACDATNAQCRLMSLAPVTLPARKLAIGSKLNRDHHQPVSQNHNHNLSSFYYADAARADNDEIEDPLELQVGAGNSPKSNQTEQKMSSGVFGAPSYLLARRSDRVLSPDKRERIAAVVDKLRADTRSALASGWTSLRYGVGASGSNHLLQADLPDEAAAAAVEDELETTTESATTTSTTTPTTTTTATPKSPPTTSEREQQSGIDVDPLSSQVSRFQEDARDQVPLGSQKLPSGASIMPQYYLGTGALSPYCVNYYQLRVLISDNRLQRVLRNNGLGSNKLQPQLSQHRPGGGGGGVLGAAALATQQRAISADGRDMLHLTMKLTDTRGRFFKGFSLLENARELTRVSGASVQPPPPPRSNEPAAPLVELTMLLNSTRPEPQRIGEAIISYYFHQVVLADRVEINYMSNISPEIRAKYSSALCPVAINDRHQLVRYVECHRVGPGRK